MRTGTLLFFLFLSASASSQGKPPSPAGFTSAKVCGECHVAIYEGWKGSLHANAVNDPVFYTIFLETSRETGGKSDPLCLSCHAPTTRITRDWRLQEPVSKEGVTCDFCHSVQALRSDPANPFVVTPGKKQWGPLADVTSPFHETAEAKHFTESRFCGGCHEYKNERGVVILGTWSEWRESPQAKEGITCQTCHMPNIKGKIVPKKVKETREVYINSHEAAGGHSVEQVKKAVSIGLGDTRRSGDKLSVAVRLENVGSGHRVPTGLPTRKLILRLRATHGGTVFYKEERAFQKVMLTAKGEVITRDSALFLEAARVESDNRLEPRRPRTEHFSFLAPAGGRPVEIEVDLRYLYQPRLIQETEMEVELGREKTVLQ